MARNADIRVWISSVLPTENLSVVSSVLHDIINKVEALQQSTKKTPGDNLNIKLVSNDKFKILPNEETYFLGDVKRAAAEFDSLASPWNSDRSYFINNYFSNIDEAGIEALGGEEEVGKLGGRIYAAIMKRYYNWERFGSTNPINITHTVNDLPIATVTIPGLTMADVDVRGVAYSSLDSTIVVFKDTDVIYKGKISTIVKQFRLPKTLPRYQEEYEMVKELISKIPVNRCEFDGFHLLNNLISTIACYNSDDHDYTDVNLAIDNCRWTMIGMISNTGGKEKEVFITMAIVGDVAREVEFITPERVSLSKLITGLNTYRLREKVPNLNVWRVGSFDDMNKASLKDHRDTVVTLTESLKRKGYTKDNVFSLGITSSNFDGVRMFYNGTEVFDRMYVLENHVKTSIYIYDSIYDIGTLDLPDGKVEVKQPKRKLFARLRSLVGF